MSDCPAGCMAGRKNYRTATVDYMMLHLSMAHQWKDHEITSWLVNYTVDALDRQA